MSAQFTKLRGESGLPHNDEIVDLLKRWGGIVQDGHVVLTSGQHSDAYINVRAATRDGEFMKKIGLYMAEILEPFQLDAVVGPETMGRDLAHAAAQELGIQWAWGEKVTDAEGNEAIGLGDKLRQDFGFDKVFALGRVAVVDDLITTGGSIRKTADLVRQMGGHVVVAGAVALRNAAVRAEHVGAPDLFYLADVSGIQQKIFKPE
jgi:orotate phosphoribosyltransferase